MVFDNAINVYADGSSFSSPRVGGIGIHLVIVNSLGQEEFEDILIPGYIGATNNQMELHACTEGIKKAMLHPAFRNFSRIAIHSDSQYVVDNYKRALFSWSRSLSE